MFLGGEWVVSWGDCIGGVLGGSGDDGGEGEGLGGGALLGFRLGGVEQLLFCWGSWFASVFVAFIAEVVDEVCPMYFIHGMMCPYVK